MEKQFFDPKKDPNAKIRIWPVLSSPMPQTHYLQPTHCTKNSDGDAIVNKVTLTKTFAPVSLLQLRQSFQATRIHKLSMQGRLLVKTASYIAISNN